MLNAQNGLQELADRAGRGDSRAASELRRQLESSLGPIVRRALRGGAGASPVAERIQAVARRVRPPEGSAGGSDGDGLVGRVSGTLATRVLGRLRSHADSAPVGCDTVAV
jgi:hypothetical protein